MTKSESSIALFNEIQDRRAKVQEHFDAGDEAKANVEAGYVKALEERLADMLEGESAPSIADLKPVEDGAKAPKPEPKRMVDLFAGPKDEFKGYTREESKRGITVPVDDALDLPGIVVTETSLPTTTVPTGGFLSSILHGTINATTLEFMRPAPGTNRLVAPTWEKGVRKPPQTLHWEQAVSHAEWIAYTMPVMETALREYAQLETVIGVEMRNGYDRACRYYSVLGNNPDGIIGILDDKSGVPEFTAADYEDDNLLDTIARMATRVYLRSGKRPNKVCMGPLLREQIRLMKRQDGSNEYLTISSNDRLWDLQIVEDEYFQDFKEDGTVTDEWLMVYSSDSAKWNVVFGQTLAAMPENDQFSHNETTFRLEGKSMLQIIDPTAFLKAKVSINAKDGELANYIAPKPAPRGVTVIGNGSYYGIDASELGDFAFSDTVLYGKANRVTVPEYSKTTKDCDGYFTAFALPIGSKIQKDSDAEKEVDDGFVVAKLGADSITAKKLKVTFPDKSVKTIQIKVEK